MARRQFYACKCYISNNLYLKELNMHFNYENKEQFLQTYGKELLLRGFQKETNSIIIKLVDEIDLRKNQQNKSYSRKCFIQDNYTPLHSGIYNFSAEFLDPHFLQILEEAAATSQNSMLNIYKLLQVHQGRIYSFPVFTNKFCNKFIEEITHFENSSSPKGRPNTMNRYGINLSELGFDGFLDQFRTKYLMALTEILYPDWGGDELDSQKAFIVTYKNGQDIDLSYHYDNAEITLNIALNDNYVDGELYFGPMRSEESSFRTGYQHRKGYGLLHRGQQMHGALPISEGERYNLIIWLRSSKIRNNLCPMCDKPPNLIPVSHGSGDGFAAENTVDLCSVF